MLNIHSLERRIEELMHEARVPGLAIAIIQDREVSYARGFGVTSVEDGGVAVTPQTLFRIGSVTKPLTGTAAMRLVEAGKLDLDRSIKDFIPWIAFSQNAAADLITLRMLMSHTAGLPTDARNMGPRDRWGLELRIRNEIPQYPLIFPPGRVFLYSNPAIDVVGYLIEKSGGKMFVELMNELVFEPLAMRRTTFDPTVAMTYPIAQSHDIGEDGALRVRHQFVDNTAEYPDGFAISTVLDLANFAILHMQQGHFRGEQLLSPESVARMHQPQVSLYLAGGTAYGLTFFVETYKGLRRVGHDGAIDRFGSKLVVLPDKGVGVVLLCNRASEFWAATDKIVNHICDELLDLPRETGKPEPIEPDRSLWPHYVGTYRGIQRGIADIQVLENWLTLDWNGKAVALSALRHDLYFGQPPDCSAIVSVGFLPEAAKPTQFIMLNGEPCTRVEHDKSPPDPSVWASYVGTYSGAIENVTEMLTVHIDDGRFLIYSARLKRDLPCVPWGKARFWCKYGIVTFHVEDDGSTQSFSIEDSLPFTRVEEGARHDLA